MQEQVPQQMGIGIEIPLNKDLPKPGMTPSPKALEEKMLFFGGYTIEQLHALITGYGKMTNLLKRFWFDQFVPWSPTVVQAHIKGLAESGSL